MASLTLYFIKNSNCEEVRHIVVSYDEDTRKKGYLIKLTHTGRFCKNDVILIKFTNAADIRVTIFGNVIIINVIKVNVIKINVIKVNAILNIISYNYIDVIIKMERISREKKISRTIL